MVKSLCYVYGSGILIDDRESKNQFKVISQIRYEQIKTVDQTKMAEGTCMVLYFFEAFKSPIIADLACVSFMLM